MDYLCGAVIKPERYSCLDIKAIQLWYSFKILKQDKRQRAERECHEYLRARKSKKIEQGRKRVM